MPLRIVLLMILLLPGCAGHRTSPHRTHAGFTPAQVAKTDIDRVTEAHQREIFQNLRLLTEKLYRRNPRELGKSRQSTVDMGVARIFDGQHSWRFRELNSARDTSAITLALREDFAGDRVLAYSVGLASMIQTAFQDKTEFFVLDDVDPQALFNAARNVEIAVWKLSNARDAKGQLLLLSNEAASPVANLSFEREFGKVIASLDILSKITADKNNRNVVKVIQTIATAVFLPIK